MPGPSLIDHFAPLKEPRQSWKVLFPLPEVLLVVLCGTLAGAEDFVEIRRWSQMHQEFLRRLLPFKAGVSSLDTLNDVVNSVDGALFAQCFTAWVEGLRDPAPASITAPEIVAIDGKISRRTHDRSRDRGPLHMVSAWASSQRLVVGLQSCEAKSNEITAIPLLLERLALTGALVTIGAMGTQTKIAQAILDRGGDYLLALKDNQASLYDEVRRYLDDPAAIPHSRFETTDGDHGRIEVRRHRVSHDVDWLTTPRRFPGDPRFAGLRAIAAVAAEVERNGSTSLERSYYLSSLSLDAKLFAHAVRCHWHVENPLHWAELANVPPAKQVECQWRGWTSCSTRTSAACGPAPDHRTWPPSGTRRWTSCEYQRTNTASRSGGNQQRGTALTSKPCVGNQRERASNDSLDRRPSRDGRI